MATATVGRRALPGGGAALSLRDFMHRSRVLALYRAFLRELVGLEPGVAADVRGQVRAGFARHAGERSRANQKALLADASRELQFVRTYVGTARRARQAAGLGADEASWVGTGEEWDVRGRVGAEWAWEASSDAAAGADGERGDGARDAPPDVGGGGDEASGAPRRISGMGPRRPGGGGSLR